jgi:hypothetical protein
MPYKNPEQDRDYKQEYKNQKERGEHEDRMERQRARNAFDKKHGRSARKGKDIGHNKPLARGGSNADGYKLEDPSKNRAKGGAMNGKKK